MIYDDRIHAGRVLAMQLARFAGRPDLLVLGLPRGGVPVAAEIARGLGAPLDVFVVRKVGVPGSEELAMGAVASGGVVVRNDEVIRSLGIREDAFQEAVAREVDAVAQRERMYREGGEPHEIAGRHVIVADDGLATGSTMRAAVEGLHRRHAAHVIVAVPVGTDEACDWVETIADEVVCPARPEPFRAVGLWFTDFQQVTDDEVKALLRQSREEELRWPSEPAH